MNRRRLLSDAQELLPDRTSCHAVAVGRIVALPSGGGRPSGLERVHLPTLQGAREVTDSGGCTSFSAGDAASAPR
jgi:hypothetical protein